MRLARRHIWIGIVGAYGLLALLAPLIAPHGEAELVGPVWQGPGGAQLLGTDDLGRDMLSRLLYGGRTTIALALAITALAFVVGGTLGFVAAIVGSWLDMLLSRLVDALMALPSLILALLVLSVLGSSIPALGVLAVEFAMRFGFAILFVSSLSFLGLGVQPPAADWGSMVRENAMAINFGVLAPLFPAAAIAGLTIAVNALVDGFVGSRRPVGGAG